MVGGIMNHLVDQIVMGHWPGVGHLLGVFYYGFCLYNEQGITSHFTPYPVVFLPIHMHRSFSDSPSPNKLGIAYPLR